MNSAKIKKGTLKWYQSHVLRKSNIKLTVPKPQNILGYRSNPPHIKAISWFWFNLLIRRKEVLVDCSLIDVY